MSVSQYWADVEQTVAPSASEISLNPELRVLSMETVAVL